MKIGAVNHAASFGRAFTTAEKAEYVKLQKQAREELGVDKTIATIFDFSVPSSKNDNGVGTTFSDDAQKMVDMLKTMCGVNAVQLQPQGQISNYIRSPYSGTGFSLGEHMIDLNKLAGDKYGNLLSEEDLNSDYLHRVTDKENADYDNVFSVDGQTAMLKTAYSRFTTLPANHPMKVEYEAFKKENAHWLDRDVLFEAEAEDYGNRDASTWLEEDRNLFADEAKSKEKTKRIAELKKITDDEGNNVVDYSKFVQFIADKQQKESKQNFNANGIEVYGDCQIGFSQKDVWAHKSAFIEGLEFGCSLDDGAYSCWSPALDFGKLNGITGDLLKTKFDLFFKRYDGVRVDAAWQLVKPLLCEPLTGKDGQAVYDEKGNKLGKPVPDEEQPVIPDDGKYIIKNIVLKTADKNKVPRDRIFFELLGGNSQDALPAVKGTGTQLIHITKYGKPDWGRVKFYEDEEGGVWQQLKPGEYIIGPGTHDNISLVEQSRELHSEDKNKKNAAEIRKNALVEDMAISGKSINGSPEEFAAAIVGEFFTTSNQFATLPDILGSERYINQPGTTDGNWEYRATPEYEHDYFANLAAGKGFNMPDALSKALYAKFGESELTKKLDKFAAILRKKGPYTTEAADAAEKKRQNKNLIA